MTSKGRHDLLPVHGHNGLSGRESRMVWERDSGGLEGSERVWWEGGERSTRVLGMGKNLGDCVGSGVFWGKGLGKICHHQVSTVLRQLSI